jgi:hypothetical protein
LNLLNNSFYLNASYLRSCVTVFTSASTLGLYRRLTARDAYRFSRLRIANKIHCKHSIHSINQKRLKKRKLTSNKSLSTNMSYLLIHYVSGFATTEPDPTLLAVSTIVYTLMNTALCYAIYSANCTCQYFLIGVQGNSICIDKRQSIQMCPSPGRQCTPMYSSMKSPRLRHKRAVQSRIIM